MYDIQCDMFLIFLLGRDPFRVVFDNLRQSAHVIDEVCHGHVCFRPPMPTPQKISPLRLCSMYPKTCSTRQRTFDFFRFDSFTLARIYNPSLSNIRIYNPQTYHTLLIMNYLMRIANPYIYMCRIANPTQRPALRTPPRTEKDWKTVMGCIKSCNQLFQRIFLMMRCTHLKMYQLDFLLHR